MTWLPGKPLVTRKDNGRIYTAKSVIIDAADNHGLNAMGFREMDFYLSGAKLPLVFADVASYGSTADVGVDFSSRWVFDTSASLVGTISQTSWISGTGLDTNMRLWVKFVTPIVFDSIIINNYHDAGGLTTAGINNAVLTTTEDTSDPSDAYNAAITGGVPIYNGVFREHIASDVADPETLTLI